MNRIEEILRSRTAYPENYVGEIAQRWVLLDDIEGGRSLGNKIENTATGEACDLHRQLESLLFELKLLSWLAERVDHRCIQYEPSGRDPEGPRVDFVLQTDERKWLIEAKSFHPDDRWTPIRFEYVPARNVPAMDGESFHRIQAVRGGLIHETIDAERKAENYDGRYQLVVATLVGFYLGREELRDFVAFYQDSPRCDDPLRDMARHYMEEHDLTFQGSVSQFWGLKFHPLSFEAESGLVIGPIQDTAITL